jgi:LytS/YehU family sensor histidine kinase
MNPIPWITIFAVLSVTALTFALVSNFWIPMLVGAITLALLVKLVR